ncbi:MAG: FAD-dependent oxidoreductase [Clostridiales bacterium]|nr:FAD-dependent oxidoreductase [Clostridiales bacterium]
MKRYRYAIVGGGLAGDGAVQGIREVDREGSIALLSEERFPPYKRPHLSKALWKGGPLERTFTRHGYRDLGVEEFYGVRVEAILPEEKKIQLSTGEELSYEKLLLATGGEPRRLDILPQGIPYRTLSDYLYTRSLFDPKFSGKGEGQAVVLGAGFIGAEMAAALTMIGVKVTMIFPETGIMERVFPPELSRFLVDYYREKGVTVLAEDTVKEAHSHGDHLHVRTARGEEAQGQAAILGLGIRPRVELGEKAGLKVEDGLVVDEYLRTSHPDIYAAGDVAFYPDPQGKGRLRVEHEDNAKRQGKLAGRNMAGAGEPYRALPFFYSDLFDLGFEAVGHIDPRGPFEAEWQDGYRKGVIYYHDGEGTLKGVLLWNVWDAVEKAERLIRSGEKKTSWKGSI